MRRWRKGFSVPGIPGGLQDCELHSPPLPHSLPSAGHETSRAFPPSRRGTEESQLPGLLSGSSTGGSAGQRDFFSRALPAPHPGGGEPSPSEPKPPALARV